MLCNKCQNQPSCMVYRLGQQDSRIEEMLYQMTRCEQRRLIKSR